MGEWVRDRRLVDVTAEVARSMQAEATAQQTLQKMVELAVSTIMGCDHASVSIVNGEFETPAASDEVPREVDRLQYESGEGPCLSAIREHEVFQTDDLSTDVRWPEFSSRAAAETGVRSMLSFRLFLKNDTLGSLNLYSKRVGAFDEDSRRVGEVFAAHAAVAMQSALEHERVDELVDDLRRSRLKTRSLERQAELAVALQRSMLTELPDLAPLEVAARYVPAVAVAAVGGDWYDAFKLPAGATALVIGDIAGHDIDAAVSMGHARSMLRALAVDRQELPGELLCRFDAVMARLHAGLSGTCVFAQLEEHDGTWRALIANAGHLPPLLLTGGRARYLDATPELLLGTGAAEPRSTVSSDLPRGSTLLLFTDGLIERRDRSLDDTLPELRDAAAALVHHPLERFCDELLSRFAAEPSDDVCLLALRTPAANP